jgi:hypothetical protein
MRRIVQTSRGWIDIDMNPHGWHGATTYGEDGWEQEGAVWREERGADHGEPTLAGLLESTATLPPDEAERIAEQVLREWDERRDSAEVAEERRGTTIGSPPVRSRPAPCGPGSHAGHRSPDLARRIGVLTPPRRAPTVLS